MTDPPPTRRPEDLNVVERLALAMGRPVQNAPTDEEMRAYYATLRRARPEVDRRARVELGRAVDPPDDGLNVVERLALAMGRPVPPRPTEEEWAAFEKMLKTGEHAARWLYTEHDGAAA